jgi:hypothetical protein
MNTSTPPHTPFPAAGTAEGRFVVPLSTLPPTAGISFEVWKRVKKQAEGRAYYAANRGKILADVAAYRATSKEKTRAYKRAYYAANKEKILASRSAYYAANSEKVRADTAAYRAANPEKVRAFETTYRKANSERCRARGAAYYAANRKKVRASQATYRKANRKKLIDHQTRYDRHRCKIDPLYRLTRSLRARLRLAFKCQGVEKTQATFKLTGCTKQELRQHLISQFREGMTLENHGKVWHIDHIRPCASFDLSDPNQAILCFHYSNLQPLFVDENLRKGDHWEPTEIRPLAA